MVTTVRMYIINFLFIFKVANKTNKALARKRASFIDGEIFYGTVPVVPYRNLSTFEIILPYGTSTALCCNRKG